MTRYSIEVVHMRAGVACESHTTTGGACSAVTNYRCAQCWRPVCGRHHGQHEYCSRRWRS